MTGSKFKDYEVGYGKPPKDTRFIKGQSGNPKGRPKKTLSSGRLKSLEEVIFDASQEEVVVRKNGKEELMSMEQIMIRQLFKGIGEGKIGAAKLLIPLLIDFRRRSMNDHIPDEEERAAMTPEAIEQAYKRLMAAG